jgi:Tfp pilus assembly protein PilF
LYGQKGDLDQARVALEQAVAIESQRASLRFQLGQVYRKSGAADKAKREFSQAQELRAPSQHLKDS